MINKQSNKKKDFFLNFLAGGTSASVSKTIVSPIERIKLLLQTQDANNKILEGKVKKYTGIINCFTRVIKEEGVISLWRGNLTNVTRYFLSQALNFSFKDTFKKLLFPNNSTNKPFKIFFENLFCGGIAGAVSLFFVYPLDLSRTRLGADIGKGKNQRQFNGLIDCLLKIFKADGFYGLYRGYVISAFTFFIYRAFYFGLYDSGKQLIFTPKTNIATKFLFAQFVTIISGIISYPLDTIRRRIMMQSGTKVIIYTDTLDCIQKIYCLEGGYKGFFKGNLSNIYRGFGASLVLVLYDEIQSLSKKF